MTAAHARFQCLMLLFHRLLFTALVIFNQLTDEGDLLEIERKPGRLPVPAGKIGAASARGSARAAPSTRAYAGPSSPARAGQSPACVLLQERDLLKFGFACRLLRSNCARGVNLRRHAATLKFLHVRPGQQRKVEDG
jgi:hypothetical protein